MLQLSLLHRRAGNESQGTLRVVCARAHPHGERTVAGILSRRFHILGLVCVHGKRFSQATRRTRKSWLRSLLTLAQLCAGDQQHDLARPGALLPFLSAFMSRMSPATAGFYMHTRLLS